MVSCRPAVEDRNLRGLGILLLTRYVTRGGASRVMMRTASALRDRGHRVVLALTRGELVGDGIPIPVSVRRFPRHWPKPVLARVLNRFRGAFLRRWFDSLVAELQPDVLYCVDLAEEVLDLGRTCRLPCVEHIHALHLNIMTRPLLYLDKLATMADVYVVPSRFLGDRLHDCLAIDQERVRVFPGGVPVGELRARAERSAASEVREAMGVGADNAVVVGCGGVNFVKGVDRFIRAAALTRDRLPAGRKVKFLWVGEEYRGSSPVWRACRNLIEELGLEECVEFLGYRDDPIPLFATADLFVVTSRAESLSLVAMEALAVGTPVVAFPVGGVPEVLSYGGGVLARNGDVESLAIVLATLLTDKERRKALGEAGKRAAEDHFDASRLLPELEEILIGAVHAPSEARRSGRIAEARTRGGKR